LEEEICGTADLELRGAIGAPNMLGPAEQDEDTLIDRIIGDQSALGSP
jgi:hypothetical protein